MKKDPRELPASASGREPLDHIKKMALSLMSLHFMKRKWFFLDQQPPDIKMATFLMGIYFQAEQGDPLNKKEAWKYVGIEDARTGRKYISKAQRDGLLTVVRSEDDKRKELLLPSDKLKSRAEADLADLLGAVRYFQKILQPGYSPGRQKEPTKDKGPAIIKDFAKAMNDKKSK